MIVEVFDYYLGISFLVYTGISKFPSEDDKIFAYRKIKRKCKEKTKKSN